MPSNEVSTGVDISGLSKAAVLAALYNASRPMGMGLLQARDGDMSEQEAESYFADDGYGLDDSARMFPTVRIRRGQTYFDYLHGRPMKVDLTGDSFDPWGFDRDNGQGAAARVIARLRDSQGERHAN